MKRFYSFIAGLTHYTKCPLCSKGMEINDRDLVERIEYPTGHSYQRFSFQLSRNNDDILVINPETEEVEIRYSKRSNFQTTYGGSISSYAGQTYTPTTYSGMFMHGLTINCSSCCQFSYTLQLHIDLNEGKLIGTYLNSETVSVEEGSNVHEIKNVYSMDKTEYTCFTANGSEKTSSIPLIPLNIDDPKETVTRIRKLLIFS